MKLRSGYDKEVHLEIIESFFGKNYVQSLERHSHEYSLLNQHNK